MTPSNGARAANRRTVRNHLIAWGLVGVVPYVLASIVVFAVDGDSQAGLWLPWSIFYFFVPSVVVAAVFAALDLGLLFGLKRSRSLSPTARKVIPAVAVFLAALILRNPAITLLVPPVAASLLPLVIIVVIAACMGVGVYISHSRHTGRPGRAGRIPRGMGPAGQA